MKKERNLIILLSFVTAAFLAAATLAFAGIYPGSEKTLLIFDMLEQFVSFYSSLKGLFSGGVSLTYSFQGSIGTPYAGTYAYYLASPISYITVLFDTAHLPDAIWLMDIIKAGLIGASFSAFAYFRGLKNPLPNVMLSCCYALSSAGVTFFILPMYLDTLYMLPIICICLERYIKSAEDDKKQRVKAGLLYSFVLGLCIMFHYYSAYMACVFLGLYAIYLLSESHDHSADDKPSVNSKGRLIKTYSGFILYSLAGVLISLPILVPVIREVFLGKLSDPGVYSDGTFIVTSLSDLLIQFICGHYGYLYSEGAPYVYCTFICVLLALAGLVLPKEKIICKLTGAFIILFLFLSFIFRPLYRMWHMFRDPVAYPHRFSFIFVFFLMVLAVKGAAHIIKIVEEHRKDECRKDERVNNALTEIITASLICIICFTLLIYNGMKITVSELRTLTNAVRPAYETYLYYTQKLIDLAKEDSENRSENGASLCRINKDFEFTSNDPMLLGFNGMDFFSSSYDSDVLELFKNMGILQYHYKVCDQGTTLVTDMLFGIDYQIRYEQAEYGYEWLYSTGLMTLYRNPYSLGIGYLASDDVCEFGRDSFANQNMLLSSVVGHEMNVFEEIDHSERIFEIPGVSSIGDGAPFGAPMKIRKFYFQPVIGHNLYFNFELVREYELDYDSKSNSIGIMIVLNDSMRSSFTGYQRSSNTYLGRNYQNEEYVLELCGDQDEMPAHVYVLDEYRFEEAFEELNDGRFIADSIEPGRVSGRINVTDENRNELIFTIAYDERFNAYVDGRRVQTYAYAGALLAIPDLECGEHVIELRYR
ncbi:MAG: YfhO family protein [Lachnospiraceae bacterium]|nr:YfhO family protein [Lachnospiraceae bacterium]